MKTLKSKRVLLGITQKDLAQRLQITTTWLGEVENGKKKSETLEKKILEELKKIEVEKFGISIPSLS